MSSRTGGDPYRSASTNVLALQGLYPNHPQNASLSLEAFWSEDEPPIAPTMPPLEIRVRERGMITPLMGDGLQTRDT
ncbi:MAG: hypothetical protein LUQ05_02725 [Methanoregula sp.]|nr:hypothetical protein [Methanoregula sp.]